MSTLTIQAQLKELRELQAILQRQKETLEDIKRVANTPCTF